MPSVRVDLVFLLLATIVTIVLIKLTSLLPASLYFNFSSAFSDELGAFLVPRPVLEAQQQCELARAKGFSFRACPSAEPFEPDLTSQNRDLLVQAVIEVQARHLAGGKLVAATPSAPTDLTELTQSIFQDLQYRDSLADFRDRRVTELAASVGRPFTDEVAARFEELAPAGAGLEVSEEGEEAGAEDPPGLAGAPDPSKDSALAETSLKLAQAERNLLNDFATIEPLAVPEIKLPELQTLLRDEITSWGALEKLDRFVTERLAAAIKPPFDDKIRLAALDIDAARTEVEQAVLAQAGWQYALALLIRLVVPFAAGALLALVAGVGMRVSIATGCAFSAFLLAWPVVLLWNGVIDSDYHHLRGVFMAFYVAYVVSFFTLAWLGATVGALAHEYWKIPFAAHVDSSPKLASVSALARQLPLQVLVNIGSNGATLILSFVFFGGDVGFKT
jgi:hypothetical protein